MHIKIIPRTETLNIVDKNILLAYEDDIRNQKAQYKKLYQQ